MQEAILQDTAATHWWSGLTANHWKILLATFLGWIFDGFETYALISVLGPMLASLLPASEQGHMHAYAGLAIGITLLGWALGGTISGIVTDYIGRKRMMLITVLGYAVFTGLTAASTSIGMLIALRFVTGLFLGGEWATGVTLLAETWPNRARPKGAGFLQSGFGFGAFLAALIWYFLRPLGPESWRFLFLFGVIPALFLLYLRSNIEESEQWVTAMRERRFAATEQNGEAEDAGAADGRRPFTLFHAFSDPVGRKRILLTLAMSLATTLGWWGIATWIPGFVGAAAKHAGLNASQWASTAGLVYTLGAVISYLASGFIADWIGRRWYLLLMFVGSFVCTLALFFWSHSLWLLMLMAGINGFFTLGQFAWYSIYLPELFGTHLRATASGVVFNLSRILACLGPIFAGTLIAALGGLANVALCFSFIYALGVVVLPFLPETTGRPLPE